MIGTITGDTRSLDYSAYDFGVKICYDDEF